MIYRPTRYEQIMKAAEAFDVRARRMFNGMGIYTGETMFAILTGDDIGLKLDIVDIENLFQYPDTEYFRPSSESNPMKEYIKLPACIVDDYSVFVDWVYKSVEYVHKKSAILTA